MNSHLRLKAVLLLSACLLAFSAPAKSSAEQPEEVSVAFLRNSVSDVVVLRVPRGAIDWWVMGRDLSGVRDSVDFTGSGIELVPENASNAADFATPLTHSREINYSIHSLFRLEPRQVEERTQIHLQRQLEIRVAPCRYEPGITRIYGLERLRIEDNSCPREQASRQDVYFVKSPDGKLSTAIRCATDDVPEPSLESLRRVELRLVPRCSHHFYLEALNAWVILHYAKLHLPNWATLERNAVKRLTTFVQK